MGTRKTVTRKAEEGKETAAIIRRAHEVVILAAPLRGIHAERTCEDLFVDKSCELASSVCAASLRTPGAASTHGALFLDGENDVNMRRTRGELCRGMEVGARENQGADGDAERKAMEERGLCLLYQWV